MISGKFERINIIHDWSTKSLIRMPYFLNASEIVSEILYTYFCSQSQPLLYVVITVV